MEVPKSEEIFPVINELRDKFDIVYISMDWHPEDHWSFQVNNPGSQLFQPFTLETGVE